MLFAGFRGAVISGRVLLIRMVMEGFGVSREAEVPCATEWFGKGPTALSQKGCVSVIHATIRRV